MWPIYFLMMLNRLLVIVVIYSTIEVKAESSVFVHWEHLENEKKKRSVWCGEGVSRLHCCIFPRNLPLQSSCGCELPNKLPPLWAVFSVFICPAATLSLEGPLLDEALHSNVTFCYCLVLLLYTCCPSWQCEKERIIFFLFLFFCMELCSDNSSLFVANHVLTSCNSFLREQFNSSFSNYSSRIQRCESWANFWLQWDFSFGFQPTKVVWVCSNVHFFPPLSIANHIPPCRPVLH